MTVLSDESPRLCHSRHVIKIKKAHETHISALCLRNKSVNTNLDYIVKVTHYTQLQANIKQKEYDYIKKPYGIYHSHFTKTHHILSLTGW